MSVYEFEAPEYAVKFGVDRLRRERHELLGELTVTCGLEGARTVNGVLSRADFNFSSARARQDRAKLLRERACTNGKIDWFGLLEDFSQRVFEAEREGDPAVDLRTCDPPTPDDEIRIHGLAFPKHHPSIVFGDGGAAKSLLGLYIAGILSQRGLMVAFFDWELSGSDHRYRLERLFPTMPEIWYCRCERALPSEADRLRRIVREHKIDYAIFDSVVFACEGPPESAETAAKYFRAVREIGCGSLHIAHINKSEDGDRKPFGSAFWHNGARSTWFTQAATSETETNTLRLGFFNRKANLGPKQPDCGFQVTFYKAGTVFTPADPSETPDLAAKQTVRKRMADFLRTGARTVSEVAEHIDAKPETVSRKARQYPNEFVVLPDGRIGPKSYGQ
jgi:hypothetical protein